MIQLGRSTDQEWSGTKVLIWGKTYPELSSKYYETVCTGGTREDGRFIRLYPIPFRYLSDTKLFAKYQWVYARVKKSKEDPRPESYKVDPNSIIQNDYIPTDKKGWEKRAQVVFRDGSHVFTCVEELIEENKRSKISLGFVRPKEIIEVLIDKRPESEYNDFLRKLKANEERTRQNDLFGGLSVKELKSLEYVSHRFKIHFHCDNSDCKGHKMSILDWEAYELVRREGIDKAKAKIESVLNIKEYDVGFFLGNFRLYQNTFAIGGIWYPKRCEQSLNYNLFECAKS